MKKYLITVKGISYEVEVEEIKDNAPQSKTTAPAPVKAAAPAAPAPAKVAPAPSAPAGNVASVTSPMPGSIFKVHVKDGDTVKRGDVLIILEAMKMENEIFASADGVVDSVLVKEGATVNTGDVLVTFK